MSRRSLGVMVGSAAITFGVALVSGIVCFFGLLLALNGFMGQERAVNASIITYIVLAILVVLTVTVMSTLTANFLQRRLDWTATVAVITSALGLAAIGVVMHIVCILIAAIVADQMRTGR
jgi:hypothetical protein